MTSVKILIILLIFLSFHSCIRKEGSVKIINDVFLSVVDTIAYKHHSLRPAPQDPVFPPSSEKIPITVYDELTDIHKWGDAILFDLKEKSYEYFEDYKILYNSSLEDTVETKLDVSILRDVGRYKLIPNHNPQIERLEGVVGHVQFSKVINANGFGLMVVTIRDIIKASIVKLIYLKKEEDHWQIFRESVVEIS